MTSCTTCSLDITVEAPPVIDIITQAPVVLDIAALGVQGAAGYRPPSSPTFTYTGDALTRIDYADGSYKVLSYAGGALVRVDYVQGSVTTRKDLAYSGGRLASITQTVI